MLLVHPLGSPLMKRGAALLNMTHNIWLFHPASSGALTPCHPALHPHPISVTRCINNVSQPVGA